MRFHIGKDGTARRCTARPGHCRLGEHFTSIEDASTFANQKQVWEYAFSSIKEKISAMTPKEKEARNNELTLTLGSEDTGFDEDTEDSLRNENAEIVRQMRGARVLV